MFLAVELQTSGKYILPHAFGFAKPSNLFIGVRKIALDDEQLFL